MIRTALSVLLAAAIVTDAWAADPGPLVYDADSVGAPSSGAPIELWQPRGTGPFPALVVLHGCQGVGEGSRSWASRLVGWGYVAAIIDSFRPRKFQEVCDTGWLVPPALRAQDAFNAARYLRDLPQIQADRLGIIGFSHGGSAAIVAAQAGQVPTERRGLPFQAAVAYYPGCPMVSPPVRLATDLLILIGQDDDLVSAERCALFADANAGVPHAPTIKIYAGAAHGFDVPGLDRRSASGHVMRNHPVAAAASYAETEAFLAARLKAR